MMMKMNANAVSTSRVSSKTGASVAAPRRVVSAAAIKGSKDVNASESVKATVAAVCLGVSLLISPVQPALAVLPPDNGAGLIKSFENAIPQPLNKKKESAAAYKDPAVEASKDKAQYSDVDYTKKASDAIKGGVQNVKEAVTGAADSAKDNASDAASDIKTNANKLSNKVAFLGFGETPAQKIDTGSQGAAKAQSNLNTETAIPGNAFLQGSTGNANNRVADKVQGDVEATKNTLRSVSNNGTDQVKDGAQDAAKSVNAFFSNKAEAVSNKAESVADKAPSANGVVSNVKNAISDVKDNLPSFGGVKNAVADAKDSLPSSSNVKNAVSDAKDNLPSLSNVKETVSDAKENVKDSLPSLPSLPNPFSAVKTAVVDTKDGIVDSAAILKNAANQPQRDIDYKPRETLVETSKAGKEAVVSEKF